MALQMSAVESHEPDACECADPKYYGSTARYWCRCKCHGSPKEGDMIFGPEFGMKVLGPTDSVKEK